MDSGEAPRFLVAKEQRSDYRGRSWWCGDPAPTGEHKRWLVAGNRQAVADTRQALTAAAA